MTNHRSAGELERVPMRSNHLSGVMAGLVKAMAAGDVRNEGNML